MNERPTTIMSAAQVGFLCKAASSLPRENNQHLNVLRSYYLMRCQELSNYRLPKKHFSSKVRCGKCCIAWAKGTEVRVRSIRLSKRQKQRIRSQKPMKRKKKYVKSKKELLDSNQIEQVCLFCKNSTSTFVSKPDRTNNQPSKDTDKLIKVTQSNLKKKESIQVQKRVKKIEERVLNKTNSTKIKIKNVIQDSKKTEVNVYSEAKDVFSLKLKKNTIASAVKEKPKVIKNNKKKKDKFAGLCQKAVLASVKLKEEKQVQNKLNLFLKPSSG